MRAYPSYSGVYRLVQSSAPDGVGAEKLNANVSVNFPKEIIVYQYPFEQYHGVITFRLAVGVNQPGLRGYFFSNNELQKNQLQYWPTEPKQMGDPSSDPIINQYGQDIGPSCSYTYGTVVAFKFSPDSEILTNDLKGVYPRHQLANPNDPTSEYRSPHWEAMPVRTELWDQQKIAVDVTMKIYRRMSYGNLGICTYGGTPAPQTEEWFEYAGHYERISEIDSGDPRIERKPEEIQQEFKSLVEGIEPVWGQVFDVSSSAYDLRRLF